MLKLLIVDDEYLVRVGICTAVDWEQHGISVIGEASNGEEAMQIMRSKSVDVVLLDLVMPVMDGITLLKTMKEEHLCATVIILSAYSDFEHVREAMRLGAVDYLLKLTINPQNLLELILSHSSMPVSSQVSSDRLDTADLWKDLIVYGRLEQEELLSKSFDLRPGDRLYLMVTGIDNYHFIKREPGEKRESTGFERTCRHVILKELKNGGAGYCFEYKPGRFAALFRPSGTVTEEYLQRIFQRILVTLRNYGNVSVSMGVSPAFINLSDAHKHFQYALAAYHSKFFYKAGYFKYYNTKEDIPVFSPDTLFKYDDEKRLRRYIIEIRDFSQAISFIKEYLDSLDAGCNYKNITQTMEELLFILFSCFKEYGVSFSNTPELIKENALNTLRKFEFFSDMKKWFLRFCEIYFDHLTKSVDIIYNRDVNLMLEYIHTHYKEKIDLNSIAGHVSISPAYASISFKKYTGKGVIEYLTWVRIEKAKELLRLTNMNLAEIAAAVCFDNMYYFSKVFKKYVHISPGRYRESFQFKKKQ
jgi:two-component system response regulator YesN